MHHLYTVVLQKNHNHLKQDTLQTVNDYIAKSQTLENSTCVQFAVATEIN